jgi:hypothetical protein
MVDIGTVVTSSGRIFDKKTASVNLDFVIGVGMTTFSKPQKSTGYPQLGLDSGSRDLLDVGINDELQCGFCVLCIRIRSTGVLSAGHDLGSLSPTSTTRVQMAPLAFFLARVALAHSSVDVALVSALEKMYTGSLKEIFLLISREPTGTL